MSPRDSSAISPPFTCYHLRAYPPKFFFLLFSSTCLAVRNTTRQGRDGQESAGIHDVFRPVNIWCGKNRRGRWEETSIRRGRRVRPEQIDYPRGTSKIKVAGALYSFVRSSLLILLEASSRLFERVAKPTRPVCSSANCKGRRLYVEGSPIL